MLGFDNSKENLQGNRQTINETYTIEGSIHHFILGMFFMGHHRWLLLTPFFLSAYSTSLKTLEKVVSITTFFQPPTSVLGILADVKHFEGKVKLIRGV